MVNRRSFLGRGLGVLTFLKFESRVMKEIGVSSPLDLARLPSSRFVVMQIGYEYNDEIHYSAMEQAGFPLLVFDTQEEAEAEARRLNQKELRGLDLAEYCHEPSDIWDGEDLAEDLASIFGDRVDRGSLTIPVNATSDELNQLWPHLMLAFFSVTETSIPESVAN